MTKCTIPDCPGCRDNACTFRVTKPAMFVDEVTIARAFVVAMARKATAEWARDPSTASRHTLAAMSRLAQAVDIYDRCVERAAGAVQA